MPHEVQYVPCERPTLHEEIRQWAQQQGSLRQAVRSLNTKLRSKQQQPIGLQKNNTKKGLGEKEREEAEWVKVRLIDSASAGTQRTQYPGKRGSESEDLSAFAVGRLIAVLEVSIAEPAQDQPNRPDLGLPPSEPLYQRWVRAGWDCYNRSASMRASVLQVLVEFPSSSLSLSTLTASTPITPGAIPTLQQAIPADQIQRLNAGIVPLTKEMEVMRQACQWLSPTSNTAASTATSGCGNVNRAASSHNLSIPPNISLLTEIERWNKESESLLVNIPLRKGFIASDDVSNTNMTNKREGFVLLAADYSQIELRILAHLSDDNELCNAFVSGDDVFISLASIWKGIDRCNVTSIQRKEVKQLCYAIIYGAGPGLIAEQLSISMLDAKKLMDDFLLRFKGITKFIKKARITCEQYGYSETLLGRRRQLHDIRSNNVKSKMKAQRQAVNSICQGSAADMIKVS